MTKAAKLGDLVSGNYGGVKVVGILTGPGMIAHPGAGWFIARGQIVPTFVEGARIEREIYVRTYKLETPCGIELTWDDVTGTMSEPFLTGAAIEGAREYWTSQG